MWKRRPILFGGWGDLSSLPYPITHNFLPCPALHCPSQAGVRKLEALFAVLIAVMMASFGVMFARAGVPPSEVAAGFLIPNLPQQDIPTVGGWRPILRLTA